MRHVRRWQLIFLLTLFGSGWVITGHAAEAGQLTAQSPPHTVAVLELYTSEG